MTCDSKIDLYADVWIQENYSYPITINIEMMHLLTML